MASSVPARWKAYGRAVEAASWLHYAVLSRFSSSDEGGVAWFRKRLHPDLPAPTEDRRTIWIHAVSAGEAKVAGLLHKALLERDPSLSVVLSATTYAGHARVVGIAGEAASFIMPLDTLEAQRRVFDSVRPDLLVLIESEFWPAQFGAAEERGVPVAVVNATLSPRSFGRHRRFPSIARATILKAARLFVQDSAIAHRYAELGVPQDRLEITGNLKLVAPPVPKRPAPIAVAGQRVTFGNLHREELAALTPAILALRAARPGVQVVLVPRYPGKTDGATLGRLLGPELTVIGDASRLEDAGGLVWLDQMGTLSTVYASSAVGVVCGTFAPIGGHDLAEPLHLGAVSVYGPHVERQRPLHAVLAGLGSSQQVSSAAELPQAIAALLDDDGRRQLMLRGFAEASEAATRQLASVVAQLARMAQ